MTIQTNPTGTAQLALLAQAATRVNDGPGFSQTTPIVGTRSCLSAPVSVASIPLPAQLAHPVRKIQSSRQIKSNLELLQ
jgi:hypothetical protein